MGKGKGGGQKRKIGGDSGGVWVKGGVGDCGPEKDSRGQRPAPQGRAYRERRHFCHVTVLVSSDLPDDGAKIDGQPALATPAARKRAKRGGAAAAPRAKRPASKSEPAAGAAAKSGAAQESR